MVRTRGEFKARATRLHSRSFELSRWRAPDHVIILPAQNWTRGSRAAQHPGPFIRADLLIGLSAQFFERREYRAKNDLEQGGVLVIHADVLLDYGKETRGRHLDRIGAGGKQRGGKAPAIVGKQLQRRYFEQLVGGNENGSAHLRGSSRIENHAGNLA